PDEVDAELVGDRAHERDHDERELEEIEEERENENQQVDDDQEPELAARQRREQVLDPHVSVDAVEGEAEDPRPDKNEDYEGRELRRRIHRLFEQSPRQPPTCGRHDQRAGRAHRAAFGRRRYAEKDGAEHQENQGERWYQHEGHTLSET